MALSVTDLTNHLKNMVPKGYTVTTTPFTTWITEAINKTVAVAGETFRERTYVDCIGDGVTTRYALPGYDSTLVPVNRWPFPTGTGNLPGVSAPTAGPTLTLAAGASGAPAGTTLYYGFSWCSAAGFFETQMSPLTSIVTTALNQVATVTLPVSPLVVSNAHIYSTISIFNPKHVGRSVSAVAVSSTTTTASAAAPLGASTAATWPLIDYVDPSTVSITEASGLPTLSWEMDATGRALTDLTPAGVQNVMQLDTALTSGQRLRAWYTRVPQLPAAAGSAILGIPDDVLYAGVEAHMYQILALNHEDTAQDKYWQAYLDSHNQFLGIVATMAGRVQHGSKIMQWATQTI